jgi:hypothetical protein
MAGERLTGRGVHPYALRGVLKNPLARMLPLSREQAQVYRYGERLPPSAGLENHCPTWECVSMVLTNQATLQARVNLQRHFTLLAITANATSVVNGGFRALLYDMQKKVRFSDRPVQQTLIAGTEGPVGPVAAFFLREPYTFDEPDSLLMVEISNLELVTNTVQLVLYGVALRFNDPTGDQFPGGNVHNLAQRVGGQ